ncbi:MAG: choice-of-anchor B family protein [Bacteroidota bacterium]
MKRFLFPIFISLLTTTLFSQLNMQLLDQLDYPVNVNDVWGWVDAGSGTEYAIVGTNTGVSIVDLSTPTNIQEVQFIDGPTTTWRDIKSWGNFVYVTNESSGGLLVVDMSGAPDNITWTRWTPDLPGLGVLNRCHNLYIDEFGYCYLAGCNLNSGGMLILDVHSTPGIPVFEAAAPAVYAHDVFTQDNKMYASEINKGDLSIYDVTNKQNISLLASQPTPFNFTHNAWVNADNSVVFTTDEKANAPVTAYDITDLNDIRELDQFRPIETLSANVIPHNVHVWDNWLIISYYTDGGIIADASRPENIIEVGNWDTFLGGNGGFSGAWGAYPFLPSGLVLLSDRQSGLMVCGANYVRACWLEGVITDAITGAAIFGAEVHIESSQANFTTSGLVGNYETGQAIPGTFDVTFSANGYITQTVPATLENGVLTTLDVQLEPIVMVSEFSGRLVSAVDGSPIVAAQVALESNTFRFTTFTNQNGDFLFTDIFRDEYTLAAAKWGFKHVIANNLLIDDSTDPVILEAHMGYQDDFFVSQGWTTQTTATTGWWQREEPIGTTLNGDLANPDADASNDIGNECFVTGNNGGNAADDDVDGGSVQLRSPIMDLTLYYDPVISYQTWFVNTGGNSTPPNDTFQVRLSNGADEVILETITTSNPAWSDRSSFRVLDYISITDEMRIIFEANDADPGHIVEAAVDAFLVSESDFPGFAVNDTVGCPPLILEFEDDSDYAYKWNWAFENGDPNSSTNSQETVAFTMPGKYDVQLEVLTKTGATFVLDRPEMIEVLAAPSTGFEFQVNGNTVDFTNTSENANSYFWSFNDGAGSTSDQENPTYSFSAVGAYEVVLAATNNCGTTYFTETVQIDVVPPAADFSSNQNDGCLPLTVEFTDESMNVPTSWSWEFPGGTPSSSTEQNPVVIYQTAGNFPVTLTVENAAGSNVVVANDLISINDVPSTGFTFADNGGTVTFTNISGNADDYFWAFNDGSGSTSTQESPIYLFPEAGEYEVTLTATNTCGSSSVTQTVNIAAVPPVAIFSADEFDSCDSATVQFFDESLHQPTSWLWQFEGGIPATSTEQNPVVFFPVPSFYNVSLIVTNSAGEDEEFWFDFITVDPSPIADFEISVNGPTVEFTNLSMNADEYLWHFNDGFGGASTEENPTHTFPGIGQYAVVLDAIAECGTRSFTLMVNITVIQPTAEFEVNNGMGCAPLAVQFQDFSSGGEIDSWQWSFPGGNPSTSSDQNPLITYDAAGTYDVQLIITNPVGTDTISMQNVVTVNDLPAVSFDFNVNGPVVEFTNTSQNFSTVFWHFGDADISTSSEINPTFVYDTLGTYVVVLEAGNECDVDTFSQIITIEAIAPNAHFSYSQTENCVPFDVQFFNESTGGQIIQTEWNFPGGSPATSLEPDPLVSYDSAGIYDVSLKVVNPVGESEIFEMELIVAEDVPTVDFSFIVDSIDIEVSFTNNSTNADSFEWHFGDGNSSTEENPIHTYASREKYNIQLIATNHCGESVAVDSVVFTTTNTAESKNPLLEFTASPNPFSDWILIEYELSAPFKNGVVQINNILGEKIMTTKITRKKDQIIINNDELNTGVYFVQLIIDGEAGKAHKIVKFD